MTVTIELPLAVEEVVGGRDRSTVELDQVIGVGRDREREPATRFGSSGHDRQPSAEPPSTPEYQAISVAGTVSTHGITTAEPATTTTTTRS